MRVGGWSLVVLGGALLATSAGAVVRESTVSYQVGDVTCRGFLARPEPAADPAPGVLVIHEWWGLNDYARQRARALAAAGYVALAADMYGEGRVATTPAEAGQLAGAVRGGPLLRQRAAGALAALRAQPGVDPARLAAIGFCFGGTAVLELAYSGAQVAGVVSFHGGLTAPSEADSARLRAKFLILHGADDPHVKPEALKACLDGLSAAKADWQFVSYSGAVHAFTNPAAGADPTRGAAYNANAARRSDLAMRDFLAELLAPQPATDSRVR